MIEVITELLRKCSFVFLVKVWSHWNVKNTNTVFGMVHGKRPVDKWQIIVKARELYISSFSFVHCCWSRWSCMTAKWWPILYIVGLLELVWCRYMNWATGTGMGMDSWGMGTGIWTVSCAMKRGGEGGERCYWISALLQ